MSQQVHLPTPRRIAYKVDRRRTQAIYLVDANTGQPLDGVVALNIREKCGEPVRVRATFVDVQPYEAK